MNQEQIKEASFTLMLNACQKLDEILSDNQIKKYLPNCFQEVKKTKYDLVAAFYVKLELITKGLDEFPKILDEFESIFKIIVDDKTTSHLSTWLSFLEKFAQNGTATYLLSYYIENSKDRECLKVRAYRKEVSKIMLRYLDSEIDEYYHGKRFFVDWLIPNFKNCSDMFDVIGRRLLELEKQGVIGRKGSSEERDMLETFETYINDVYGLLNKKEVEDYIKKPWIATEEE